ncbi:MAG: gliding motility-associated C-terminal domain-containing protein, partial [Crocinitomicaceae bacterium]|nr:gliding motility-associated C-terminal domain-containing protein [Crocinitomicaceae bacterium]
DFSLLSTINSNGTDFIYYNDGAVMPDRGSYEYRINLIDSCGNVGFVTNVARTVFLQISTDHVKMINTLSWSAYSGFDGSIIEYRVYRGVNGVFDSSPLAVMLPGVRSYEDDVSAFMQSEGQFCYRVEAVESLNSYNLAETAFSNTVCTIIDPVVYIPNAFIVNGENPVFLPVVSLYDFDSYLLTIYDRWGGVVFQTDDREEGWNGESDMNNLVPEGTYVYHLQFNDRENKKYDYRGFVTMLIDAE